MPAARGRGIRRPDRLGAESAEKPSCRAAAIRLLSRRDYTVAELRARLLDRSCTESEVDEVIALLIADRSLDDRRVAAAHVRTATAVKGRGRLRVQRELEARGVARDTVRELVAEIPLAADAEAIASYLRRQRATPPFDPALRRRLFQRLLRRGFPADAVGRALRWFPSDGDDGG